MVVLLAIALFFSVGFSCALSTPNLERVYKQSSDWLYTLTIHNARLSYLKGRRYQLRFKLDQKQHSVLAFADRPVRQSMSLTPHEYRKVVLTGGKRSFVNAPPNAALTFASGQPRTSGYEINSYQIKSGEFIMNLTALSVRTTQGKLGPCGKACEGKGDMFLFIDSGFK